MPRSNTADNVDISRSLLVPVDTVGGRGRGARRSRAVAFLGGMLLGLLGGAAGLLLLLLMAAARQPLISIAPSYSDPDITIGIRERYLNKQANDELQTTHPIVLPYVSVTSV